MFTPKTLSDVENFRIKYMSKKGLLSQFFVDFQNVSTDKKKEVGQALNQLKQNIQSKIDFFKEIKSIIRRYFIVNRYY